VISNFVSIPVAASGRVCADWFTNAAETQNLLGAGKTEVNLGWIYLNKFVNYTPSILGQPSRLTTQDSTTAQFLRATPFDSSNWGSVGGFSNPGCIVTVFRTQSPFNAPLIRTLDAGPSITMRLPDGSTRTLGRQQNFNYLFSVSDATPGAQLFIPSAGVPFRFQIPGGADVGAAEASINTGNPMVWNEHTSISTVNRNQPLTVTWRGGSPDGFVIIQGGTFTGSGANDIFTAFGRTERASVGRFTVPRDILASMVPSANLGGFPTGTLLVQHFTLPARFTAPGLDHGSIIWVSYNGTSVNYQ